MPSYASVEVISVVRKDGRLIKKRTIEPAPLPLTFPDGNNLLFPKSQEGPQPKPSTSEGSSPGAPDSSVAAEVEQWIPHRTEFLHELLRLEAPPPKNPACATCKSSGEYRCLGCFTGDAGELVCKGCLLSRHANNPFHEVQIWDGQFFKDATLAAAGFIVPLPHHTRGVCTATCLRNLTVFNLSGAHRIVVRYCDCPGAPLKHIQLFRARWFPTTIDRPSTAFGFDILDFFHKLENQKKCNQYDFYQAIIQRADVAGLTNPEIRRYDEIFSILRLWGHLKLEQSGATNSSSSTGSSFSGS